MSFKVDSFYALEVSTTVYTINPPISVINTILLSSKGFPSFHKYHADKWPEIIAKSKAFAKFLTKVYSVLEAKTWASTFFFKRLRNDKLHYREGRGAQFSTLNGMEYL